jgi:predicted enzyme related to lactoylglutathione lyase
MNLNYLILYVQDMDKLETSYTDVLGMEVVEAGSSPTFITLRLAEGAMIGLQDKSTSRLPPAKAPSGSVELSFAVNDVDATWKQWKEQGVEIVSDPVDLPFGRYFLAQDPEGHYLSAYRFGTK